MIKSEPSRDHIQAIIDLLGGTPQAILDVLSVLVLKIAKPRLAGKDGVDRAE